MKLTTENLAELAGVSGAYIRRLTRDGVLPKPGPAGYDPLPAVKALIAHYKSRNERADDIARHKLDKTRAEAELLQIRIDEQNRVLVPSIEFGVILIRALEGLRAVILSASNLESTDQDKLLRHLQTALDEVGSLKDVDAAA